MRLLLIEDNPGDVRLLQEYLLRDRSGQEQFQLVHADRLARGLERLAEAGFDAVLLDLSLPDSQGPDTVIRARAAAQGIPIVVMTSIDDDALGVQLLQAGAQDYLVKGEVTGSLLRRSLRYAVERKRAEKALSESESRFRAILDYSPGLVFLKDLEGRYLHVNRQYERTFHMNCRDIVGKSDDDLFPPQQAAQFRANDRKVLEAGVPLEFEEVATHDDGPHTSIVFKFLLRKEDGHPYALCGITTDITDRKRAEVERQRLVKDRLLLLESTGEGIYGVDLEKRFTFMNKAAARMLGYRMDEVLGKNTHSLVHHSRPNGSPYPMEECRIFQCLRSGQGCQVDDEMLWRQDGTGFPVEYTAFPIVEGDAIVGAVVTFTDITERKRAEEELQRTLAQLRTLSQRLDVVREDERTRIARELHDELGVRLTCLKLDLARLQSLSGGSLPRAKMEEKVRSMMADVDSTIASVQRLVVELRPGILDDLGLVAAIEWQCQDFERRSGTRCVCKASKEAVHLERSHATAAFRICQEALTNVARHAKATSVLVRVEQANGELLVEVQDDGQGITAEQLTDSASLGLLGMRERARGLGGRLEIAARPDGKGTTVTLRLPCSEHAHTATREPVEL